MKIDNVEVFHADAGWRPWTFIKITTNEGLVGWSECTDSHGSPQGIHGVVKDLTPLLIGHDPQSIQMLLWHMTSRTRQSPGSIIQKAIAGIENALWDIKGKALGVPVYDLMGGAVRDKVKVYWSHCATSRVRASELINKPKIASYKDLMDFGMEFKRSGYTALKTNIAILDENPHIYMPGFYKSEGGPELNPDRNTLHAIDKWIGCMRDAVGDSVDIALDLNFNFKTEGYIKIGRMLEQYDLSWLEIDSYDPIALKQIKESIPIPVISGENLYGLRQFRPYITSHSMDSVSIDVIWNGFSDSKKIADFADLYEMNICPHNYNGYLSTFISIQLCALVPNVRIAEIDVDDVPWREELFTAIPIIEDGYMRIPTEPGWGVEIDEKALTRYKWPK